MSEVVTGDAVVLDVQIAQLPVRAVSALIDIAVIAVASYMTDMYEHLYRCADHGVNAITLSEEALYPWNTSPMQTAELDRLARRNGVTITGTGHQDVYWVNLVSMVLATSHRIETVTGQASWNVDDFGPEVVRDQRVDPRDGAVPPCKCDRRRDHSMAASAQVGNERDPFSQAATDWRFCR